MVPPALLRPSMRLWYSRMLAHAPFVPAPRTAPFAGATGAGADRVLVLGNGPMHGWGVTTHGLSAVGQLADALTRRSGRGVHVEFAGDERMTVASAEAWLGGRSAEVDLVVVALGLNDALRLTRLDGFERHYRALLGRIRTDLPAGGRVALVTVPHVQRYSMAQGRLGRAAARHADRLSAVVRACAAGAEDVHVIEAPGEHFDRDAPLGSPAFFRDFAEQLAVAVGPLLDDARAARSTRSGGAGPTAAQRVAAAGDAELAAIADRAKALLGVAAAAVNLVDGDRVMPVAHTGGVPAQMPRSLAYCGIVADQGSELLVPDAGREERFRGNAFLEIVRLPFYAGVPLIDPVDGSVMGTLCVLDGAPRPADAVAMVELRLLAEEAAERLAAVRGALRADEPRDAGSPEEALAR